MSGTLKVLLAAPLGALIVLLVAPLAMNVAVRTNFLDRPAGYKGHQRPTPYLGGAAMLAALLAGVLVLGGTAGATGTLVACAVAVWAVGTFDDRRPLGPGLRLALECGLACVLWRSGLRWTIAGSDAAGLALTVLWFVGSINAFNLMDNMDGAATTVAGVSFAAIGLLALVNGATAAGVLSLAMCGACVGFLPYNLAGPARIFLGDGGSMVLGFLVAGLALLAARSAVPGSTAVLAGALLAGLPLVDTTLVVISRVRRKVHVLSGGRDHMTHRLHRRVGGPRSVARVLAVTQGGLAATALIATVLGTVGLVLLAAGVAATAAAGIFAVEFPGWTLPRPLFESTWVSRAGRRAVLRTRPRPASTR